MVSHPGQNELTIFLGMTKNNRSGCRIREVLVFLRTLQVLNRGSFAFTRQLHLC